LLGVLSPVEGAEQNRALDFGIDGILKAATGEQIVELPQL
jgi:hypothetical protein